MTEPTSSTPGADAASETVTDKLRGLRAKATSSRPAKRTRATKRTAARKSTGPAAPARGRSRYGDKLVGWAKLGVPMVARHPVRQAILLRRVDELGPIVDRLAQEDPRVAQVLERISGLFGRGGAWAELGGWAVTTGGALALTSGYGHPVLAMLCGGLVQQAIIDAATQVAWDEAQAQHRVDELGNPIVSSIRVQQLAERLAASMRPAPPADDQADVERIDQADAPADLAPTAEYPLRNGAGPVGVPT